MTTGNLCFCTTGCRVIWQSASLCGVPGQLSQAKGAASTSSPPLGRSGTQPKLQFDSEISLMCRSAVPTGWGTPGTSAPRCLGRGDDQEQWVYVWSAGWGLTAVLAVGLVHSMCPGGSKGQLHDVNTGYRPACWPSQAKAALSEVFPQTRVHPHSCPIPTTNQ